MPSFRIAVVPDHPRMEVEAHAIANALRKQQIPIFTLFKGNAKKQSEKAKQAGVMSILYVRDEANPKQRLHLTNINVPDHAATRFFLELVDRFMGSYSGFTSFDQSK